ncbi:MAG: molecular chaperone HtpG [Gammaproteobacteria bacterium]|nr:molecular chaperone HtpG [Gammaproteobacteria bacterium]
MSTATASVNPADLKGESFEFQAEVPRLLHLMVHSLYSNKEIFLRELISNASDACDKLRFEGLKNEALFEGDGDLHVTIRFDADKKTLTFSDNGIGMTRDEVIANLGTIARSGTREFFASLSGDQAKDAQLIGQFGVGFYSAFIVADEVTVETRKAGTPIEEGVLWRSKGEGRYALETISKKTHGTEITLQLKEEESEFLDAWRLRSVIKRYSDHVTLPIWLVSPADNEDENAEEKAADKKEQINSGTALWRRSKKDLKDQDYIDFYQSLSHDFQAPLAWTHNHVEGRQEYTNLFYIPAVAPFDLWDREHVQGVKLYVQRVFIMDDSSQLLPRYLRFVRGLIDSSDLPLNVSREILQSNKLLESIRSGSVKKILALLQDVADKESEKYKTIWSHFGNVIKEGVGEDAANREAIAKLLRFATTRSDAGKQEVSLDEYVARLKDKQNQIYFVTADSETVARNSPHLEIFRKHDIEVILLHDRVDEWMMQFLREYAGKSFVSIAKGDLDLGDLLSEADKQAEEVIKTEAQGLVERLQNALVEQVDKVRATTRLIDSPACVVLHEHEMALYMQKLMKQAGHDVPGSKPVLEINPQHPLLQRIASAPAEDFSDWAQLLLDQALLAEGAALPDTAAFVKRMNRLLLH